MKIYVGNLPEDIKGWHLDLLFRPFGEIASIHVMQDKNNKPKGFAYVLMSDTDGRSAIDSLNGKEYSGKVLEVREVQQPPIGQGRFKKENNGIIIDTNTGLTWVAPSDIKPVYYPISNDGFQKAEQFCNNFSFSGYNDWRLPLVSELIDLNIALRKEKYMSFRWEPVGFWCYQIRNEYIDDNLNEGQVTRAHIFDFAKGRVDIGRTYLYGLVRPVRITGKSVSDSKSSDSGSNN